MTTTQLISLLILFSGVLLLGLALLLYLRRRAFLSRSVLTQGEVTEVLRQRASGKYIRTKTEEGYQLLPKYLYRPVVRFTTRAGETVEFLANVATRPSDFQVGQQVALRYDPANPQQAVINRFIYVWFGVLMCAGFGVFFVAMGVLGFLIQQ
jgi:hypothetical protein